MNTGFPEQLALRLSQVDIRECPSLNESISRLRRLCEALFQNGNRDGLVHSHLEPDDSDDFGPGSIDALNFLRPDLATLGIISRKRPNDMTNVTNPKSHNLVIEITSADRPSALQQFDFDDATPCFRVRDPQNGDEYLIDAGSVSAQQLHLLAELLDNDEITLTPWVEAASD